jgi:Zn finger protein HypA/HybF involved in hydrogenase expression
MEKTHFHNPIFWTACNMSARSLPLGKQLQITKSKEKVTCGNCKLTQGFFSRDDVPTDEVHTRTIVEKVSTMSLWSCPKHGLYGGQITCPKCGFQGKQVGAGIPQVTLHRLSVEE